MDVTLTPKMQKRIPISLSLRGLSASKSNQNIALINNNGSETPCSPSVQSICLEANFHTPPHRRLNLNWDENENADYSPKIFDTSFSPTAMLSQSLVTESPEVGWRWTDATPDSAYPDSSFTSAGCSSTESKVVRTRGDLQRQQQLARIQREEQRRAMEIKIRRAEKMRADDLLKKRCAKLQEHLENAAAQNTKTQEQNNNRSVIANNAETKVNTHEGVTNELFDSRRASLRSLPRTNASVLSNKHLTTSTEEISSKANETLSDFFNNSELDCLLIEATQGVESKMVELTQKNDSVKEKETKLPNTSQSAAVTPTSSSKEKRSSFYMKFLEDDNPEDWFDSLDDIIKEATQAKKPRTSLQRYNSMPATTTSSNGSGKTTTITSSSSRINGTSVVSKTKFSDNNINVSIVAKMKRHSSSYALSPGSSSSDSHSLDEHLHSCQNLVENIVKSAKKLRKPKTSRRSFGFRQSAHAYCPEDTDVENSPKLLVSKCSESEIIVDSD